MKRRQTANIRDYLLRQFFLFKYVYFNGAGLILISQHASKESGPVLLCFLLFRGKIVLRAKIVEIV